MTIPDSKTMLTFASPQELHRWLRDNYATAEELWIRVFKIKSGVPSVTWPEIVEEILCWGWIDGIKKSLDDDSYMQRITPRKSRSVWSKRNVEISERLIREGRMKEAGLIQIRAAKEDGRWEKAYVASELEIPADFLEALNKKPKAQQFFDTLTKSNRHTIAYGLTSAKRPETRMKRFSNYMQMLENGEKPR